jgi:hypothetical protein
MSLWTLLRRWFRDTIWVAFTPPRIRDVCAAGGQSTTVEIQCGSIHATRHWVLLCAGLVTSILLLLWLLLR